MLHLPRLQLHSPRELMLMRDVVEAKAGIRLRFASSPPTTALRLSLKSPVVGPSQKKGAQHRLATKLHVIKLHLCSSVSRHSQDAPYPRHLPRRVVQVPTSDLAEVAPSSAPTESAHQQKARPIRPDLPRPPRHPNSANAELTRLATESIYHIRRLCRFKSGGSVF